MKKVTVVIPMDDEQAERINKLSQMAYMTSQDEVMCANLRAPVIKELFRLLEECAIDERVKWRVH